MSLNIDNLELQKVTDIEKARVKQHVLKKRKKAPIRRNIAVASVMIIGTAFTFGTYIADAAETLINQLFGSRENLTQAYPDVNKEEFDIFEQGLAIAQENLTEEEFNHYSQLLKEQTEIFSRVQKENREYPNDEEEKRLDQIEAAMQTYKSKFLTIQAEQLASFPFTKPTYIPEGYKQVDERYPMRNGSEEPVVLLNFSNGESEFSTQQLNVNQKADLELKESGFFEKTESYSLHGVQFDYVSSKEKWIWDGMRVTVPEKGYKIIIIADGLSKGIWKKYCCQ